MSSLPRLVLVVAVAGSFACGHFRKSDPEIVELEDVPSAEELYATGIEALDGRDIFFYHHVNHQAAIDAFQEVIDNYPYSDLAVQAELKIADAYFDSHRYEEALSYYQDFPELHPNHERVPYTILRSALCYYERVRSPNRDQRPTREALAHLDKVMSIFPYTPEAEEAELLWRDLRTRLGKSVMMIGDFYMKRDEWQSAADRYRSVLNEFPGLGLDADALYKLGVCYTRMDLEDEAERIFQVILDNYEGTEVADAAADLIPAAN